MSTSPAVEFTVLGAGAIGSILSAHLACAGRSVAVLARGQRAQQIQREGLRITGLAEISTPVPVLTDPSQLRETQVLIVATKASGTAAALQALRHIKVGTAFSIQNGLLKNELLAETFGQERVLGALANISGELRASGEVQLTRNVNVLVGEPAGGLSPRAQRIAQIVDDSGVRATAVPDIVAQEWSKFVSWVGLVCMSLTTRSETWRFLSDADCALVLVRLVREVATLAEAHGIELPDDRSVLPLQTIIESPVYEAVTAIQRAGDAFRAKAPGHRISALQDLEAGRPLEVEETLGHALRLAQRLQLQLPLLEAFYHLAAAIDRTRS